MARVNRKDHQQLPSGFGTRVLADSGFTRSVVIDKPSEEADNDETVTQEELLAAVSAPFVDCSAILEHIESSPTSVNGRDRYGNTALHCLCMNPDITPTVLSQIISPHGPRRAGPSGNMWAIQNKSGNFAMHYLCGNPNIKGGMAKLLHQRNPNAIKAKHANGSLPLHLLCMNSRGLCFSVLEEVIECWPQSVRSKDSKGLTPLHLACKCQPLRNELEHQPSVGHLDSGFSQANSSDVLRGCIASLLDWFPDAAKDKRGSGTYPFHLLCKNKAVTRGSMQEFLEWWPEAATTRDDAHGDQPLHALCSSQFVTADLVNAFLELSKPAAAPLNKSSSNGSSPTRSKEVEGGITNDGNDSGEAGLRKRSSFAAALNAQGLTPVHVLLNNSVECKAEVLGELLEDLVEAAGTGLTTLKPPPLDGSSSGNGGGGGGVSLKHAARGQGGGGGERQAGNDLPPFVSACDGSGVSAFAFLCGGPLAFRLDLLKAFTDRFPETVLAPSNGGAHAASWPLHELCANASRWSSSLLRSSSSSSSSCRRSDTDSTATTSSSGAAVLDSFVEDVADDDHSSSNDGSNDDDCTDGRSKDGHHSTRASPDWAVVSALAHAMVKLPNALTQVNAQGDSPLHALCAHSSPTGDAGADATTGTATTTTTQGPHADLAIATLGAVLATFVTKCPEAALRANSAGPLKQQPHKRQQEALRIKHSEEPHSQRQHPPPPPPPSTHRSAASPPSPRQQRPPRGGVSANSPPKLRRSVESGSDASHTRSPGVPRNGHLQQPRVRNPVSPSSPAYSKTPSTTTSTGNRPFQVFAEALGISAASLVLEECCRDIHSAAATADDGFSQPSTSEAVGEVEENYAEEAPSEAHRRRVAAFHPDLPLVLLQACAEAGLLAPCALLVEGPFQVHPDSVPADERLRTLEPRTPREIGLASRTPDVHIYFHLHGSFLGRYHLHFPPVHESERCVVLQATDLDVGVRRHLKALEHQAASLPKGGGRQRRLSLSGGARHKAAGRSSKGSQEARGGNTDTERWRKEDGGGGGRSGSSAVSSRTKNFLREFSHLGRLDQEEKEEDEEDEDEDEEEQVCIKLMAHPEAFAREVAARRGPPSPPTSAPMSNNEPQVHSRGRESRGYFLSPRFACALLGTSADLQGGNEAGFFEREVASLGWPQFKYALFLAWAGGGGGGGGRGGRAPPSLAWPPPLPSPLLQPPRTLDEIVRHEVLVQFPSLVKASSLLAKEQEAAATTPPVARASGCSCDGGWSSSTVPLSLARSHAGRRERPQQPTMTPRRNSVPDLFAQAVDSMAHFHSVGLVHGNLTPRAFLRPGGAARRPKPSSPLQPSHRPTDFSTSSAAPSASCSPAAPFSPRLVAIDFGFARHVAGEPLASPLTSPETTLRETASPPPEGHNTAPVTTAQHAKKEEAGEDDDDEEDRGAGGGGEEVDPSAFSATEESAANRAAVKAPPFHGPPKPIASAFACPPEMVHCFWSNPHRNEFKTSQQQEQEAAATARTLLHLGFEVKRAADGRWFVLKVPNPRFNRRELPQELVLPPHQPRDDCAPLDPATQPSTPPASPFSPTAAALPFPFCSVSTAADVWALGCLLFFLASGGLTLVPAHSRDECCADGDAMASLHDWDQDQREEDKQQQQQQQEEEEGAQVWQRRAIGLLREDLARLQPKGVLRRRCDAAGITDPVTLNLLAILLNRRVRTVEAEKCLSLWRQAASKGGRHCGKEGHEHHSAGPRESTKEATPSAGSKQSGGEGRECEGEEEEDNDDDVGDGGDGGIGDGDDADLEDGTAVVRKEATTGGLLLTVLLSEHPYFHPAVIAAAKVHPDAAPPDSSCFSEGLPGTPQPEAKSTQNKDQGEPGIRTAEEEEEEKEEEKSSSEQSLDSDAQEVVAGERAQASPNKNVLEWYRALLNAHARNSLSSNKKEEEEEEEAIANGASCLPETTAPRVAATARAEGSTTTTSGGDGGRSGGAVVGSSVESGVDSTSQGGAAKPLPRRADASAPPPPSEKSPEHTEVEVGETPGEDGGGELKSCEGSDAVPNPQHSERNPSYVSAPRQRAEDESCARGAPLPHHVHFGGFEPNQPHEPPPSTAEATTATAPSLETTKPENSGAPTGWLADVHESDDARMLADMARQIAELQRRQVLLQERLSLASK